MFNNEQDTKALIEQVLKEDTHFAEAYKTRKDKSIDGFIKYFFECAQDAYVKSVGKKSGCMTSISPEDVRALLVHYWTEDKPKVGDITLSSFKGMAISTPSAAPAKPSTPPATPKPNQAKGASKPGKGASKRAALPTPPPAPTPAPAEEEDEWD